MRVIDTNTGAEVHVGDTFSNVHGRHTLVRVEEGLLSATGHFITEDQKRVVVPLTVRYTHPAFFFQKVAFIPS